MLTLPPTAEYRPSPLSRVLSCSTKVSSMAYSRSSVCLTTEKNVFVCLQRVSYHLKHVLIGCLLNISPSLLALVDGCVFEELIRFLVFVFVSMFFFCLLILN